MTRVFARFFALTFPLACGGDATGTGADETDPSEGSIGSSGSSTGGRTSISASATTPAESESGVDATSSSAGDEASTFDVGMQSDLGPTRRTCSAVDFLFVVDDSSSMQFHQANLIANFPAFIEGIESTLVDVESYQVGVVATDPFSGNPGECILIGALVTSTEDAGPDSSDMQCGPYAEGFNFMTQEDDLAATFSCAAQVGTMGNGFERPMDAVVEAVSGNLGGPGGCNEGFLRDEALLVVVVITDEYDGEGDPEAPGSGREPPNSMGTPQTWYDAVLAAKNDTPEAAVALGVLNYEGGPCPPVDLGHDGANIVAWVELFGANGFLGGICEDDYAPFFAEAVDIVADACANFVPEG
jgi:hypothetical protein